MNSKGCVVVSGINFFEGGPLTLIKDCIRYLENSTELEGYSIRVLISNKEYYRDLSLQRVILMEFPEGRKSYLNRLYYEYVYFKKFAIKFNVKFWLSLHDVTPRLNNIPQAVYCHNPAPFYKASLHDFKMEPSFGFFSLFYKYLYRINIHRNRFIIVQQQWIREQFVKLFNLPKDKIIVAHPAQPNPINLPPDKKQSGNVFIYPTMPRAFKNVELIGRAIQLLNSRGITSFTVIVTIDGSQNGYGRWISETFGNLKNLELIGKQPHQKIAELYSRADYLLFPSKLETWGLPISEFKQTGKPLLLADLPYAHETLGSYHAACFFNSASPEDLADKMEKVITNQKSVFVPHISAPAIDEPYTSDWGQLFSMLLNGEKE